MLARGKSYTFLRMRRTRPWRWKTRWTWISLHRGVEDWIRKEDAYLRQGNVKSRV